MFRYTRSTGCASIDETLRCQHEGRVKIKFVCFFFKWNDILFTYEFKIIQGQSQGRIIYLFRMESILFILENFL